MICRKLMAYEGFEIVVQFFHLEHIFSRNEDEFFSIHA